MPRFLMWVLILARWVLYCFHGLSHLHSPPLSLTVPLVAVKHQWPTFSLHTLGWSKVINEGNDFSSRLPWLCPWVCNAVASHPCDASSRFFLTSEEAASPGSVFLYFSICCFFCLLHVLTVRLASSSTGQQLMLSVGLQSNSSLLFPRIRVFPSILEMTLCCTPSVDGCAFSCVISSLFSVLFRGLFYSRSRLLPPCIRKSFSQRFYC